MGTVFSFDVRGADGVGARAAVDAAVAWLHRVDEVFSPYRPDSEISRLADGRAEVERCSPEVAEVLALCEDAERRSGGFFSARYAGRLDPTGLVKGWAVERAARMLVAAGAEGACLNGGGDVQAFGRPEPGRPWRLGVSDPLRAGQLACVVEGTDELAVATSGPAERGCHIVDPHTGSSPAGALASVTVVGAALTHVDAWATAAYARGAAALAWLEEVPGVEGVAVTADGDVRCTSGFASYTAAADRLGAAAGG